MPSITITVDDRELRRLIANTGGPAVTAIVADGVEYGIYQEFGVENGFGKGIKIPAHPFMKPAVEAVRPGWDAAFKNQLTNAQVSAVVRKAAFDIERGAKERAPTDTHALQNSIHVVVGDVYSVTFESGQEA